MALMCVPSASQWPFSTGSRLVVAVMMMSLFSAAISGCDAGTTSVWQTLAHLARRTALRRSSLGL